MDLSAHFQLNMKILNSKFSSSDVPEKKPIFLYTLLSFFAFSTIFSVISISVRTQEINSEFINWRATLASTLPTLLSQGDLVRANSLIQLKPQFKTEISDINGRLLLTNHTEENQIQLQILDQLLDGVTPVCQLILGNPDLQNTDWLHLLGYICLFFFFHFALFLKLRIMQVERLLLAERQWTAQQLSHDLKSPLAALNTLKSVILNGLSNNQEAYELFDAAHQRIETMISNSDSKVGSHLPSLRIDTLLDSILAEKSASLTNITFGKEVFLEQATLPSHISGTDFARVVSNLVTNAHEAYNGHVTTKRVDVKIVTAKSKTSLTIRDYGNGITPTVLKKIGTFGYTIGKITGSGLGLYFVRRKISAWGGRVSIDTVPGKGTVINVQFPNQKPNSIRLLFASMRPIKRRLIAALLTSEK